MFFKRSIIQPLFVGVLSLCLVTSVNAATLYKWTDEEGLIHYSERPPVGVTNYERIRSEATPGNKPIEYKVDTPKDEQDQASAEAANNQAASAVNQERCANARKNLEALNSFARIRVKEDDGQLRFLSEEEIVERRQEYRDVIANECQ